MMLFMTAMGIAFAIERQRRDKSISWHAFDENRLNQLVASGRCVIVFAKPTYRTESEAIHKVSFGDEDVVKYVRQSGCVPMLAEYDFGDTIVDEVFKKSGTFTQLPFVAVFHHNTKPVVSTELSPEDILDTLKSCCHDVP